MNGCLLCYFNFLQPTGPQSCVWWDFEATSSYGAWKSDGCEVHQQVDDVIVCACSHLTNFAVMMVRNKDLVNLVYRIMLSG